MAGSLKISIVPHDYDERRVCVSYVYREETHQFEISLENVVAKGDTPEKLRKKIEKICQRQVEEIKAEEKRQERVRQYRGEFTWRGQKIETRKVRLKGSDMFWEFYWRGQRHEGGVHFSWFTGGGSGRYDDNGLTEGTIATIKEFTINEIKGLMAEEEREKKLPRQEMKVFMEGLRSE